MMHINEDNDVIPTTSYLIIFQITTIKVFWWGQHPIIMDVTINYYVIENHILPLTSQVDYYVRFRRPLDYFSMTYKKGKHKTLVVTLFKLYRLLKTLNPKL